MTRPPKADGFRAASLLALDEYARACLDAKAILDGAAVEAAQGFCVYRFTIERALDLRETAAAKALVDTLAQEGFKVEWERRVVVVSGCETTLWQLKIEW